MLWHAVQVERVTVDNAADVGPVTQPAGSDGGSEGGSDVHLVCIRNRSVLGGAGCFVVSIAVL